MSEQSFSLIPFPASNVPHISLTGRIALQNRSLVLRYILTGEIGEVLLPSRSVTPERKDELWKMTCFEFFLGCKDLPEYWEFNLSPSGDWNVYYMSAYRRIDFKEERSIQQLPFSFLKENDAYVLDVSVDLGWVLRTDEPLQIGITAIIQTQSGAETYWALVHPAPEPDFHLRDSFILELAEPVHPAQPPASDD